MKNRILKMLVLALLLTASGSTVLALDGVPAPICYPKPCPAGIAR